MITVTAIQTVVPGREADLEALMADLTAQIRANEPGCVGFDYVRPDRDGPTRLVVERYRDEDALEAHKTTAYLRDFIPAMMQCLAGPPEVQVFRDVAPRPVPPPSFFHTGIVVPDLERAVARYSDILGIRFTEPAVFDIPRLEDPDPHPFELTAVMSMTEPPWFELIQADGDGIISAANAGGILYYGIYEDDMAERLEQLDKQGVRVDARLKMDADSVPFVVITGPDLCGGRIEYVSSEDRAPLEEWVRTGVFPGGVAGGGLC